MAALFAAWKASRRTTPACHALFGLSVDQQRRLRTLALAELLVIAQQSGSVTCAMSTVPGLWRALSEDALGHGEPSRRSLLIAVVTANRRAPDSAPKAISTLSRGA